MPSLVRLCSLKWGLAFKCECHSKAERLERINSIKEYNLNVNLKDEIWVTFVRVNTILLTGIIYVFALFLTS